MSESILITGGAGFIGSNFVHYVNRQSPETRVRVFDDLSSGLTSNLHGAQCEFVEGTLLDNSALVSASKGASSIVHLGAIGSVPRSIAFPMPSHHANATGTLNVLEAARVNGVPHVIVASSSSVYGDNPSLPKKESDWTRPLSPYAASKLAAEAYALSYGFSYGMHTLALRFFNVFGPRQRADHDYAAVIPKFIDAALSGKPLIIYGDGKNSRDFTYVESVCSALLHAVKRKLHHSQPVNLAFGTSNSLKDLIRILEKNLGKRLAVNYEAARRGDVLKSQADPTMMRKLFPELLPFDLPEGIEETIEWFRQ